MPVSGQRFTKAGLVCYSAAMENTQTCPLCASTGELIGNFARRTYYRCGNCKSIFLAIQDRLSPEREKHRYELHNNDVEDPRYQRFVSPLVDIICSRHEKAESGLDFGAGPGPVIAKMLRERSYTIELYDPFFHPDEMLLKKTYDYIICCEVIEHFYNPAESFALMKSLMKPNGKLYCRTVLLDDNIHFPTWHYKNDETHTFFYHRETLQWIGRHIMNMEPSFLSDTIVEYSCQTPIYHSPRL